ncbi:MAG: hypothetical protein U5R06_17695 [candidate division KSB1 bacterium]|nr:hypothetical protein [candidate division KSB1 bacterium]
MTDNKALTSWGQTRIGYQCFVDSFSRATDYSRHTDVYGRSPVHLNWSDPFDDYCYGYGFYGGDLPGTGPCG